MSINRTAGKTTVTSLFSLKNVALCCFLIVVAIIMVRLFHHVPQPMPMPPLIKLISCTATTLSNTHPATWNLTISVSNPNPKSTIYYNNLTVVLFYNNHSDQHNDFVFLGADLEYRDFFQPEKGYNIFSSNVSFSTHDMEENDLVERFLDDQNKGSVMVSFGAYFLMDFDKDIDLKTNIIYCDNVVVNFKRSSASQTVLGLASDLPKAFYSM